MFRVFTSPFAWKLASSDIRRLAKNRKSRHRSINQLENCRRRQKSSSRSAWRMFIWYGCQRKWFLVIILKLDFDKPEPFRLALTCGSFSSKAHTASTFPSDMLVLYRPEFPLWRSKLVPLILYFLTLYHMVDFTGGSRSGNLLLNASCTPRNTPRFKKRFYNKHALFSC